MKKSMRYFDNWHFPNYLTFFLCGCSNLFGNIFVYLQFHDDSAPIDESMRLRIVLILSAFVLFALVMMLFLPPPMRHEEDDKIIRNPLDEVKKAFKLLLSKTYVMLCPLFIYTGKNRIPRAKMRLILNRPIPYSMRVIGRQTLFPMRFLFSLITFCLNIITTPELKILGNELRE